MYDNKLQGDLHDHFNVGYEVIVTDGSYMTDEHGNHVPGIYFNKDGYYELLTVTKTNIPFDTSYHIGETLGYHNNCEIQGFDGKKYYCSRVNIKSFSSTHETQYERLEYINKQLKADD